MEKILPVTNNTISIRWLLFLILCIFVIISFIEYNFYLKQAYKEILDGIASGTSNVGWFVALAPTAVGVTLIIIISLILYILKLKRNNNIIKFMLLSICGGEWFSLCSLVFYNNLKSFMITYLIAMLTVPIIRIIWGKNKEKKEMMRYRYG